MPIIDSMALSKRIAAVALLAVLALAPAGAALHAHGADVQAGHADCTACQVRHLSEVETAGVAGVLPAPVRAAGAVAPVSADGASVLSLGIRPTRGPPA